MENNIYSTPNSGLMKNESDINSTLAGRWQRLWASLIDTLTIAPFTLSLMYFTGGFKDLLDGMQPSFLYTLGVLFAGILIFLVIHGRILFRDGQTWGKRFFNVKIVTLENELPNVGAFLTRYGFYWVVPQIPVVGQLISIINILFIFSKSKMCIHDHVAKTKVVKANKSSKPDAASSAVS